ncbi:MAG TPA: rod-binding protein [Caulobacteraceae bacterium]|nr:rod-binding protein [Caulobacteraceae bacterium]
MDTPSLAPPTLPAATPEQKAKIEKVGHDFESAFLEVMLGQMFSTVQNSAFGGGEGEEAFKSFLTSAFADSMVKAGGVGLSKQLTRELLKMQGLSEGAPA